MQGFGHDPLNHPGVFMPLCFGPVARLSVVAVVAASLFSGFAAAQTAPAPAPAPTAPDPVVAKVDGKPILLSDIKDAAQNLPENASRPCRRRRCIRCCSTR